MGVAKLLPGYDRLHEQLSYDSETGEFTWKVNKRGRGAKVGRPAGTWKPDGYLSIMVDRKRYPAQRIAWKMVTGMEPGPVVDHEDGDTRNNRFLNLRDADLSKNMHNSALPKNNTSGFKCVFFHKGTGLFSARISVRRKIHYLGYYNTAEEAAVVANEARPRLHGEFACHGNRGAT
jgi:hypothetical protein